MRSTTRRRVLGGMAAVALGLCVAGANAAGSFPDRPIRIIVPYSAGGGTDTIARHLSDRLTKHFGQPVIVENRPGANGIIGTRAAAVADPDGYTYVLVVNSHLINPLVQKDIPYDTFKDFVGVTMVARSPLAVTGKERTPAWPDVPTMGEMGMKEFDEVYTSYSLYAPSATPKPVLEKMQQAVHTVVMDPEVKQILAAQAAVPVADSVDDFNKQVKKDFEFWKSLAEAIDLKPV